MPSLCDSQFQANKFTIIFHATHNAWRCLVSSQSILRRLHKNWEPMMNLQKNMWFDNFIFLTCWLTFSPSALLPKDVLYIILRLLGPISNGLYSLLGCKNKLTTSINSFFDFRVEYNQVYLSYFYWLLSSYVFIQFIQE